MGYIINLTWAIDPGKVGVNYNCAFPNTVEVDGNLKDLPWQFAPWHEVPHDKGTNPAPSDKNASYSFAAVADDKWLYIAFKIKDDKIRKDEDVGCNVWKDDSVEIYIDAGHEQNASYDKNDAQITIGADNIGGDINKPKLGGCVGITQGPTTGTIAAVGFNIIYFVKPFYVEAELLMENIFQRVPFFSVMGL